jgi:rubredoxin
MRSADHTMRLDAARIDAGTKLECKVCWYVYDPARGDTVAQVAPGTPFSELPAHWTCPNCDGGRDQFIVAGEG